MRVRWLWLVGLTILAAGDAGGGPFAPVTRVLEKPNVEYAYPHWSKDGRQILFQSNEHGKWQILVMVADGTRVRPVLSDAFNDNYPDWAPDNRRICFVSDRDGNEEIYVVNVDGTGLRRLTSNPERDIHPYWTPAGDKILFSSTRDGSFEIYEMNADGTGVSRLSNTPDHETCARQSPTGNRLVYLRNNDAGLDDVFVMDRADGSVRNVTRTPGRDGWPSWTPDGDGIVFSAIEDGGYKLFHLRLATGALTQLTDPRPPAYDARPSISADGTKIVFNRQTDGEENTIGIYVLDLGRSLSKASPNSGLAR